MVFKGSRYASTPVVSPETDNRTTPRVLGLRPVPPAPGTLTYTVMEGDRLDQLANRFYSDPRKYWLILDANPEVLNPFDLLQTGRQIRIPGNRV
jgi:nucleoid-associated protein YgaU